jgi:hypothetical protein
MTSFEKTVAEPMALAIEVAKARAMGKILSGQSELMTPALRSVDEASGVLEFERLEGMMPFTSRSSPTVFGQAGRGLGIVHKHLSLASSLSVTRKEDEGRQGLVFVHGDYSPLNLARLPDGRLALFDWGLRPWTTELYTRASPAVDLAAFIAPFLLPAWWDMVWPESGVSAFLAEYSRELGPTSDTLRCARRTWDEALDEQLHYLRSQVSRRHVLARGLHKAKLGLNCRRLAHGVQRWCDGRLPG